jgi:hypothetical protein
MAAKLMLIRCLSKSGQEVVDWALKTYPGLTVEQIIAEAEAYGWDLSHEIKSIVLSPLREGSQSRARRARPWRCYGGRVNRPRRPRSR